MKTLITASLVAAFWAATVCGFAAESKSDSQSGKSDQSSTQSKESRSEHSSAGAYLGVAVESLPAELAMHFSKKLGEGRGLLVLDVADDSPAEKAGIEAHDVLVSLDDHALHSPEQFMRMVRHDQAGQEVTLAFIHAGESKQVKVKLAPRPADLDQSRRWSQRPNFEQQSSQGNQEKEWLTFDSMNLTRAGKDKFKAEIKYRNDQGKMETHSFQGTRDELRKDIDSEKDLPKSERRDLLRALDLAEHPMLPFPGVFWFEPDSGSQNQQGGQQGNQWQRDTVPWR